MNVGALWRTGATVLAFSMLAGSALAENVKLKFAVFSPDTEITVKSVFVPFVEALNAENAGVEIEFFPNGALGRNPQQQAQMVLDGVADLALVVPSYTPGRFQENQVFELPNLFADMPEATLAYTRLVQSGKIKGYEDFFPVAMVTTAPYSIHTNSPITSLNDLNGKKIRSTGAIEGEVLKAFGAAPIGMPITEVPEAIGRKTIDGTTAHPSALFDWGIVRVTSDHYMTRLGIVPLVVLMNRQKFESLPQAAQDAIRKYAGDWMAAKYIEGIGTYNASLMQQLETDPAHKVVVPSQADMDAVQPAFDKVIDGWAAAAPRNKELLDAVREEIAAVRAKK
ncbi:MAG: TRAP transporter substrate-binding protein DctP [Mesorhizobium sp.]